jgi:type IV secretory pathway VirB2 component (pilin)
MSMFRRFSTVAVLLLLALALTPVSASACATCFGAEDSGMTRGMNGAILTLLGIIGVVQVGFVTLFGSFIVRSRRLKSRESHFPENRGGSS